MRNRRYLVRKKARLSEKKARFKGEFLRFFLLSQKKARFSEKKGEI